MLEVEFLPAWYSRLRHQRRLVALQTWLMGVVVLSLGLWTFLATRNAQARESTLATRKTQLMQSGLELEKLAQLEALKTKMSEQAQLVNHLGLPIPMGRMFNVLETMMSADMALLDIGFDFEQQTRALSPIEAAALGAAQGVERQLNVKMHGVAPSDVEVGNLMIRLATIPHFGGSSMTTQDLHREGHLMRDFTVSFTVDLNNPEQ